MEKFGKCLILVPLILILHGNLILIPYGNCQPEKESIVSESAPASKLSDSCSTWTGIRTGILPIPKTGSTKEIFTVQDVRDFKDKVLSSSRVVVVVFHAPWCGPCRHLIPRLEAAVKGLVLDGQPLDLDLAKVDIDQLPQIATDFNVAALPTVLAFRGGRVIDQFVGDQDDSTIKKFLLKIIQ